MLKSRALLATFAATVFLMSIMPSALAEDLTNTDVSNVLTAENEMFYLNSTLAPDSARMDDWTMTFSGYSSDFHEMQSTINVHDSSHPNESQWCPSWADVSCLQNGNYLDGRLYLPPCSIDGALSCIEGISITREGVTTEGTYIRSVALATPAAERIESGRTLVPAVDIPAVPSLNIPIGTSPSMWNIPGMDHMGGSSTYSIGASLNVSARMSSSGQITDVNFSGISTNVFPYKEVTGPFTQGFITNGLRNGIKEANGHGTSAQLAAFLKRNSIDQSGCVWLEVGACGVAAAFDPNSIVKVKLRVPNKLGGWLHGRLSDANVQINPISASTNSLVIEGKPIEIPVFGLRFDPHAYPKFVEDSGSASRINSSVGMHWTDGPMGRAGRKSVDRFREFEPALGSQAVGRASAWNFQSIMNAGLCRTENTTTLQGLLTTNAPIYNAELPQMRLGMLTYEVGGLHHQMDGSLFNGTYDFIMRSDTARCIYGFTKAPIQVAVSVTDSGGVQNTATTAVTESGGWLRIRARNFTFSTPSVNATFSQVISATAKKKSIGRSTMANSAQIKIGKKDKVTLSVVGANKKYAKSSSSQVKFKKAGTYRVTLKVKHYKGATETATFNVTVK